MTELEHKAAEHAKDYRGHRLIWVALALIVLGIGYYVVTAELEQAELHQLATDNAAVAQTLADQLEELGEEPEVPPPGEPPVPIATDDAIRDQLIDYFADHPTPTVADVTRIATRIYAENPPADGKRGKTGQRGPGPTADQLAAAAMAAVADYCANEACRGPGPTDEEMAAAARAAVEEYCAERNECAGPKGDTGATGAEGPAGPVCREGRELQTNVIATTEDGHRYRGDMCVDPDSEEPAPPGPGG